MVGAWGHGKVGRCQGKSGTKKNQKWGVNSKTWIFTSKPCVCSKILQFAAAKSNFLCWNWEFCQVLETEIGFCISWIASWSGKYGSFTTKKWSLNDKHQVFTVGMLEFHEPKLDFQKRQWQFNKMNGIPIGYLINKMCKLFFSALQNIGKSNIFVNNKGYVAMVLAVSGWLKLCQLVEIFCSFKAQSAGSSFRAKFLGATSIFGLSRCPNLYFIILVILWCATHNMDPKNIKNICRPFFLYYFP